MQTKVFISEKPERLDVFLADKLDKTRSAIKKIIDDGNVTIKGETVKAGKTLKCGEEVTVIIPELKPLDVKAEAKKAAKAAAKTTKKSAAKDDAAPKKTRKTAAKKADKAE